ncbi:MAG: hypothetical protein ACOYJB_08770 [Christensenellaceae bacterium]
MNRPDFGGRWKGAGYTLEIVESGLVYRLLPQGGSLGIQYNDSLAMATFDPAAPAAGIGIYIPAGDGSFRPLWSSIGHPGKLGMGTVTPIRATSGFCGEYDVCYSMEDTVLSSFTVQIDTPAANEIHRLSWKKEETAVLHGAGFPLDGALAFAWGSVPHAFDLHVFTIGDEMLRQKSLFWDSPAILQQSYIRE